MPDEMKQQPAQTTAPTPQPTPTIQPTPQAMGTSGMGIASLVLGILAIMSSFLPIINNGSFFLALLGAVFAIVGIIATKNGKKGGRGIAIAGLVLNILSVVIVLATQSMYGAAIDAAVSEMETGSKPVAATTASDAGSPDESSAEPNGAASEDGAATEADYSNMAIGDSVEFKDGTSVTVDGVITGLTNYNDEPMTGITVTYRNNGDKNISFNTLDWKAQDGNGVLDNTGYYSEGENELHSGQLSPGGSVTGNIYFNGEIVKAFYYDNLFQSDSEIAWNLQ